nr:MAG TPA: hypothetical protein [Herelleviridae sp.]
MCGITTSNNFCEIIISVMIVPWVHPHAKRFIGVVWSMDVIERITPRWINDRTGGETTRLEDMTSTIRTFGFEHVASELFWLALIFCDCFFSLFGGINGIIPIAPIGDKRLINIDVEDVAEAIKSVVEIGLDIEVGFIFFGDFIGKSIVEHVVEKFNESFCITYEFLMVRHMYSFVVSDCCETHSKSYNAENDQSNVECDL